MKALDDFLRPTQKELFMELDKMYKGHATVCEDKYIMLLAHLDTVHRSPVRQICRTQDGGIWMSPQGIGGDDRCGVYALVTAYRKSEVKPWLLFTCDEETGGVGAHKFSDMHRKGRLPKGLDGLKILVELDRRGKDDAVYYGCDNPEFEDYITSKGFNMEWGSFSDISVIAPELGVAAVNLSSGYYNAHTQHEYINKKQLDTVVRKVAEIVADAAEPGFPKYEYIERRRPSWHESHRGWLDDMVAAGGKALSEERFLDTVPKEIRDCYEALLDYYTVGELESLRAENGDKAIPMMCEAELGFSYSKYRKDVGKHGEEAIEGEQDRYQGVRLLPDGFRESLQDGRYLEEDLEEGRLPEPPGSWLVAWMQRLWSVRLG